VSDAGVTMVGTTGSGKTTFLGALNIALTKQASDWLIYPGDAASRTLLAGLSHALTGAGELPPSTQGIDNMDWVLTGQVRRNVQKSRFGGQSQQQVTQQVKLTLKLTDPTGELARYDQVGMPLRDRLVDHLASSRGILYMFDPIREFEKGDAYETTSNLLMDLAQAVASAADFDGRLPHHVAVCVTKLDDTRVFRTAQELGTLVDDPHHPHGFPRVHDSDAEFLLSKLCEVSKKGNGEALVQLLGQYFRRDRIKFFATSAVGFYVNERTRKFDVRDTRNVYQNGAGKSLVRGPVNPINVMEPVLWLAKELAD
jgi:hypothetical protein